MKLSALILTKNEEQMIGDCLKQLNFANEIIVLDQNSTDSTLTIAKKYTSRIYNTNVEAFDKNRNTLAQMAKGEWLLYLDADERISADAISAIKKAVWNDSYSAYYFPRKNLVLGKWLKHGGWWPDYVPRLFKKDMLISWVGEVHESPQIKGKLGYLKVPIEHLTARSLSSMFVKTTRWARVEAQLFYKAGSQKVTIFRVIRASLFEFISRYFLKAGFLDGTVGLIEAIFQSLHQSIILTYLWELQNNAQKARQIKSQ